MANAKRRAGSATTAPVWKLEDAKARFSEVVRLARERGPQRVTVRGRDAVVVLAAEDYARLAPQRQAGVSQHCSPIHRSHDSTI